MEKEICIYCMGDYGTKLFYLLNELGIVVKCFGDADKSKQGYAMEGLYCVSYEEVCRLDKKDIILVVAKKNPQNIIQQFQQQGFEEVYSDKEMIQRLGMLDTRQRMDCRWNDLEEISQVLAQLKEVCYGAEEVPCNEVICKEEIHQLMKDCVTRKQYECCRN